MLVTLCSVGYALCTLCSVGYTLYSVLCRLCSVLILLFRSLYSVSVGYALYSVLILDTADHTRRLASPVALVCKITSSHYISMKQIEEHNWKMDEYSKGKIIYYFMKG